MEACIQDTAMAIADAHDFFNMINALPNAWLTPALRSMKQLGEMFDIHLLWPKLMIPDLNEEEDEDHELIQEVLPLYSVLEVGIPSYWEAFAIPATTKISITQTHSAQYLLPFIRLWKYHIRSLSISFDENDVSLSETKCLLGLLPNLESLQLILSESQLPVLMRDFSPLRLSYFQLDLPYTGDEITFDGEMRDVLVQWLGRSIVQNICLININANDSEGREFVNFILSRHYITKIVIWDGSLINSWPQATLPAHVESFAVLFREYHNHIRNVVVPLQNSRVRHLTLNGDKSDTTFSDETKDATDYLSRTVLPTLTQLEEFSINNLPVNVSAVISLLPQLTSLTLTNCAFTDEDMMAIAHALPRCGRLMKLHIYQLRCRANYEILFRRLALPTLQSIRIK